MRYLLSQSSRTVLERLGRERTLCAFDFDGTLAPIVDHPESARMRVGTTRLLAHVARLYPCVVISGRGRADVLEKLGDLRMARVIGNHGAETDARRNGNGIAQRWKNRLAEELETLPGVWLEDKGSSLAVHYRQSARKAEAKRGILAATKMLAGARTFGGKQVVNIVEESAPHKGDALIEARDRLRCDWILYIGDDDNDEDAFAVRGKVVAVRIGRKALSKAGYFLRSQREIDELLRRLIAAR